MKVFERVGINFLEIQDMFGEAILLSHLKHRNIISVSGETYLKHEAALADRNPHPF